MPLSLFPTPYPMQLYKDALAAQSPMGDLIAGIIGNPEKNIYELLDNFSSKDAFMARLIEVSKEFNAQRARGEPVQDTHCVILRNDFMIDEPTRKIKLVEYNTVAVGFLCLSEGVKQMQRYVVEKYGDLLPLNYGVKNDAPLHEMYLSQEPDLADLPIYNPSYNNIDNFIAVFSKAITMYKESTQSAPEAKPWVLFVIEDSEKNVCD